VALLTKTTWIILLVLWPLMWVVWRLVGRRTQECSGAWTQAGLLAAALTAGLVVVNAGYLFQGTFQRLGDYGFRSAVLSGASSAPGAVRQPGNRFRGTWLGNVPIPLPVPLVASIDLQKWDFENYRPAFLGGRYYSGGCWYFYLYAALVKWPLGFWVLLGLSFLVRARPHARDLFPLAAPPLVLLALVSATATPGYFRYLLPVLPILIVWCARVATPIAPRQVLQGVPGFIAALWLIASSLSVYPHSLSYFNEFAGGPSEGHAHLIDCNVDWGQDLLELKEWIAEHPQREAIYLAYNGPVNPRLAGIDLPLPPMPVESASDIGPGTLPPGVYILSVHLMRGGLGHVYDETGRFSMMSFPQLRPFPRIEPIARVGYSIYVYQISNDQSARRADHLAETRLDGRP
jgi:hypothetical protein